MKYIVFTTMHHVGFSLHASESGTFDAGSILWWDYSSLDFQSDAACRATDLVKLVRTKQPGVIMNNRLYRLYRLKEAGWAGMGERNFLPQLDTRYGNLITPEQRGHAEGMPDLD